MFICVYLWFVEVVGRLDSWQGEEEVVGRLVNSPPADYKSALPVSPWLPADYKSALQALPHAGWKSALSGGYSVAVESSMGGGW